MGGGAGRYSDLFPVSGLLVFVLNIWWALERELVQWHCLLACQRVSLWSLKLIGYWFCLITHSDCVRAGCCCISAFFMIVLMCSLLASSCKFRLLGSVSLLRALLRDANNCIFAAEPFSAMVPWGSLDFGSI